MQLFLLSNHQLLQHLSYQRSPAYPTALQLSAQHHHHGFRAHVLVHADNDVVICLHIVVVVVVLVVLVLLVLVVVGVGDVEDELDDEDYGGEGGEDRADCASFRPLASRKARVDPWLKRAVVVQVKHVSLIF